MRLETHNDRDPRSCVTISDQARDIIYRHAYRALARGDEDAAKAMGHFARAVPAMKITSLRHAADMARSWSECCAWAEKRLQRKGFATAVSTRRNKIAMNALLWIGEALHSLADD